MAMLKGYRIVLTTTSVAHNLVTGTTASSTGPYDHTHVGRSLHIQNKSTGAFSITVGSSGVVPTNDLAAASTSTGPHGFVLTQNESLFLDGWQVSSRGVSAYDVWIASTSSNAICVGLLHKAI